MLRVQLMHSWGFAFLTFIYSLGAFFCLRYNDTTCYSEASHSMRKSFTEVCCPVGYLQGLGCRLLLRVHLLIAAKRVSYAVLRVLRI